MKWLIYLLLPAFSLALIKVSAQKEKASGYSGIPGRKWWKEAIVYQVYPRSFKDSDGDGVGDLKGIASQLDYIKSLGIDVIWLNPIYGSPNDDNGYDISDYQGIMKEFGTMKDFDNLLKGMHERGIKLVMDLVVNHSSDEHRWFKESRKSRNNPYRHYYHWWPQEKGVPNQRVSFFDVNGDAWKYDSVTRAWYLHYFSRKQPDLNWENPKLRHEIFSMMKFWFNKGVDGFRMDVIPFISKDTSFPPIPAAYNNDWSRYYGHGPHVHEYLREMNKEVLSKYDVMTVAEGAGTSAGDALLFTDPARHELNMLYHFDGVSLGYLPNEFKQMDPNGYSLVAFKNIYSKWDSVFSVKGWGTIYLGNHDQPRMVTRWGNDDPSYRAHSAEMLTTFLFTMRATPYFYNGDELGMTNIKFDSIQDYRDIESLNMYKKIQQEGGDLNHFLQGQKISARDNGRTPFQWDKTANAGFTSGTPWIKVNPDYREGINRADEENDPNSILNYFRKIVKLRKQNPVLVYGKYQLLDKDNPKIYVYTRTLGNIKTVVLLNFTKESIDYTIPVSGIKGYHVMINNYQGSTEITNNKIKLQPYQGIVLKVN